MFLGEVYCKACKSGMPCFFMSISTIKYYTILNDMYGMIPVSVCTVQNMQINLVIPPIPVAYV